MFFTASSLPFLTPTFFPIVPPRSAAELPIGGQVAQGILEDLVANTRQEVAWAALSAFTGASPLGVPAQKASGARVIGTGLNFLSGSGLAAFGGGAVAEAVRRPHPRHTPLFTCERWQINQCGKQVGCCSCIR